MRDKFQKILPRRVGGSILRVRIPSRAVERKEPETKEPEDLLESLRDTSLVIKEPPLKKIRNT